MEFLKIKDLQKRYGLSRTAIYRWRKLHDFPKSKTPSETNPRYSIDDILEWERRNQIAA